MAVNDIYEFKVGSYLANQAGINVYHAIVAAEAGTGATQAQIALAANNQFAALYKALLTNPATYYGVRSQRIRPGVPGVALVDASAQGPGLGGVSPLPTAVSGIITWRTGFAGRSYRGRTYIPFPAEEQNDGSPGAPTAAYVTALTNLATVVLAGFNAGIGGNTTTFKWGVYQRSTGTCVNITGFTARSVWATQRRRGAYGRPNLPPPF